MQDSAASWCLHALLAALGTTGKPHLQASRILGASSKAGS